jgi:hypothetical protein
MTRQDFLAWNASSAGMMEIIEFLEELVDLAKLLVGVNAFRSGMLERPRFHEYIAKIKARESESAAAKSKFEMGNEKNQGGGDKRQRHRHAPFSRRSLDTNLRRRRTGPLLRVILL